MFKTVIGYIAGVEGTLTTIHLLKDMNKKEVSKREKAALVVKAGICLGMSYLCLKK